MKGFDVLHVKSAVKSRNKFDLSFTHLTTLDFGQIVPLLAFETIPGDDFPEIDGDYFSRLAPLVKPTYGKFSFKTVSAFVPYHQVAYDADAWLDGKTTWEGTTPVHRYFTVHDLDLYLRAYCLTTQGANAQNSQYTIIDSGGTTVYYVFTPSGRYYFKVLCSLGYTAPQGVDYQSSSTWYTSVRTTPLSAYPLLAFVKLYNDYMSQSQRFNSSVISDTLRKIKYNISITNLYANGLLSNQCINTLLSNVFLNYENGYFTSAWQTANQPISGTESITNLQVPSSNGVVLGAVTNTNADDMLAVPVVSTSAMIGKRALDFLNSFDAWVKRNNYSGSRAVQQIYSRFGIKTDDYRSHYANVISTDSMPVQVGDVTATANETNVPLGDYAGKGIMSGNKSISVKVSDYGLILIVGYMAVSPMNAFGYDKKVLRSTPLDYYNPEFDGIGAEAIPVGELWASPIVTGDTVSDNSIFGFTERYNSYRYGRDMITGDFRDYRINGDMNVWHTGRNLSAVRTAGNLVAQSSSVNTLPQVNSEYNRIFSVTSGDVDHFYLTARFKVTAIRPMLNLNQVTGLGEGDTVVPRNGNVIA